VPVVINEFEVVAEPPPKAPPGRESPRETPGDGTLDWTVSDIEQVVRRQAERAARLRAD
jgi:hypothetical protein